MNELVARLSRRRPALVALSPFCFVSLVGWCAVLVGSGVEPAEYAASWVLVLFAGTLARRTMRDWRGGVVPSALAYLAAVALLRNAAGGIASGVQALFIVPVFAAALFSRSRWNLSAVLLGVALAYLVPILAVGGVHYPQTQYRATLMSILVLAVVGLTTQRLVVRVGAQAEEAGRRHRMLERVSEAVRRLLDSPEARDDACRAALALSEAAVVALHEPDADGRLIATSIIGIGEGAQAAPAARDSPAWAAFASGEPQFVDVDVALRVGNPELWERAGRPASILYQPLRRARRTIGVLVVAWPDRLRVDDTRRVMVTLLAQTIASVLVRADEVDTLTDRALTDPLTGLPNRRAWDEALREAGADGGPFVVAMLDLDRFKEFNDAFGHPAGDRLLKAAAAAWRSELRVGDLLARVGGEEFGLLLRAGELTPAREVVERLRRRVPEGRTCSAGIAARREDEGVAAVVARADVALYAAKAGGRDRAQVAAGA